MNYNKTVSENQGGKTRKIDEILSQLTPENRQKQIKEIQEIELPLELQKWIQEYEKVGERSGFIWKWTFKISGIITLSCVSKKYLKSLRNVKFITSMFIILLDDITDKVQNEKLLNELLKIPFKQGHINYNHLSVREERYIRLSIKLWKKIKSTIKKYPRFKEFKGIFDYDIKQIFNSMKYAYLVNKNLSLINKKEYWLYFPHSMQAMIYSTLDLMCSKLNIKEVKSLREIIGEAQKMARIGNWVSTWEREIEDKDFTSGIFAYAIDMKLITPCDLKKKNKVEIIKRVKNSNIETKFLKKWEDKYYEIKKKDKEIKGIDIKKLLFGLEKLLVLELISKNYK